MMTPRRAGEDDMIVLNVTYKCGPGVRERFLDAIRAEGIDAACRAEPGNLKYDYYVPADDDGSLLLVEKWRDAAALAEHAGLPHYARLQDLKKEFGAETALERFEIPG